MNPDEPFDGIPREPDPDDIWEEEDDFLREMMIIDFGPYTTHMEHMARDGVILPPPAEITDEELPRYLNDFIQGLARRKVFLSSTDHLSDRELYSLLWHDLCRHETPDLPLNSETNCHMDILGGCSDIDIDLHHMYYSDEEERRSWMEHFPDYEMPESKKPPYDRDRHLPRAYGGESNDFARE